MLPVHIECVVDCRDSETGECGVVTSHKVTETTVTHTMETIGGSVSESMTTTVEELKTVEGIITSCMETTSSGSIRVEKNEEGIHRSKHVLYFYSNNRNVMILIFIFGLVI